MQRHHVDCDAFLMMTNARSLTSPIPAGGRSGSENVVHEIDCVANVAITVTVHVAMIGVDRVAASLEYVKNQINDVSHIDAA